MTAKPRSEKFERGLKTRRAVLGAEYVDRSLEQADDFNWSMQELTTEWCWDEIWNRPGLDRRSRSILNLGMIAALNRPHEFKLHVRGAINNGLTKADIREVFLQTPRLHEEAALALGATRWEMVRTAVLPFARSGIVSAAMLGLGRALGETMAVLMILSPGFLYSFHLLVAGEQQTIAANIAAQFPEANPDGVAVLIATGLALFLITLAVNMAARAIVARRKDFSGAN